MNRKLYISDWHYGHENIITFDNRPFSSVEEMNEQLITNWNNEVQNGDLVYILGDMFWCKGEEAISVLKKLNGQKILIKGNHDRNNDARFLKCFQKVTEYLEIQDGDKKVILCHYPIPYFKNHYYDYCHLYGHVHRTKEYDLVLQAQQAVIDAGMKCQMYNVGAMMPYMGFVPRTLEHIIVNG